MAHTVSSVLVDRTLNQIMAIESAGKPKAKAPTSSALGLFQFLNGTWLDTANKHRPDLFHGRTTQQVLALRTSPPICIELGARFTEDNAAVLGHDYTDGDLYLAHFLGAGSARKVLRAAGGASAVSVCGQKAAAANRSIFYKNGSPVTCAQLRRWAAAAMEHRWDALQCRDFVAEFYRADDPLVSHHVEHHEPAPEDAPIKHEENFGPVDDEPDEPDEPDAPVVTKRAEKAEPNDDVVVTTVKSAFKSKISWIMGLFGLGSSSVAGSADPETSHLFVQLLSKPFFWVVVLALALAGCGIYFYWRDHGKGSLA